jgi:hypothetical protein
MTQIYYLGFADEEFKPETVPKMTIMDIANLEDGWCQRKHCRFEYTDDAKKAHTIIHIWLDEAIAKAFNMKGFSVTHFVAPPRIYFNLDNIQTPPKKFTGTKEEYLKYVVQHELGHAIFKIRKHDKEDDRHPVTRMCSIMYQQTRKTEKCLPGYQFYANK